jgi:hypothetical protein
MRKFLGLLGVAVFVLGVLGVLGGRLMVESRDDGGGVVFWSGIAMVLVGSTILTTSRHKTCPSCKARAKAEALRCDACGNTFGGRQNTT